MKPPGLVAGAILTLAFLLIYLPDVGHGFIRDDFMWVRASQIDGAGDVGRIFRGNTGFYRPAVTLSFGVDRALFGIQPFPYGVTNVLLLIGCAYLVARVGSRLGLPPWAAGTAGALWAFNFHAVNMALLWISGRTALLLCLFALLATLASFRHHWWQAGWWCLLALLAKEEAVTLPFVLAGWSWYSASERRYGTLATRTAPVFLALIVYGVLRASSGAFGPSDAPSYYQFTFVPADVLRNAVEYLDRAATFVAATALVMAIVARTRPRWTEADTRIALFAAVWFVAGFALTVFLPLRSSLYALYPSIGVAIAGGRLFPRLEEAAPNRMRLVIPVLLLLPFLLLPIYRQRNQRWIAPAEASRLLVADLQSMSAIVQPQTHVVALDTDDEHLDSVFSGLFGDAVALYVRPDATGEIIPARDTARWQASGIDHTAVVRLQLGSGGHLVRVGQ
jgi:hypothetical protein